MTYTVRIRNRQDLTRIIMDERIDTRCWGQGYSDREYLYPTSIKITDNKVMSFSFSTNLISVDEFKATLK